MDVFDIRRAADYLTENHEHIADIQRKMYQDINSLTTDEMYELKIYLQMNQTWIMRLNQAINTPTKSTKKFWKR
jgi:hypothetical protein